MFGVRRHIEYFAVEVGFGIALDRNVDFVVADPQKYRRPLEDIAAAGGGRLGVDAVAEFLAAGDVVAQVFQPPF